MYVSLFRECKYFPPQTHATWKATYNPLIFNTFLFHLWQISSSHPTIFAHFPLLCLSISEFPDMWTSELRKQTNDLRANIDPERLRDEHLH